MAKVKTFKTIFPAVSVPLNDDYSINEPEFRAYLRWIKSFYGKGIEGLVCNGHTGEITGLTRAERKRVVEICSEECGDVMTIISGVNCENTAESIAMAKEAKEAGADGILLMPPHMWLRFGMNPKVEKIITLCIVLMIVAFYATLVGVGGPEPQGLAKGLFGFKVPEGSLSTALAFISTNAAVTAGIYGTYLGKEKKWKKDDLFNGVMLTDAITHIVSVSLISGAIVLVGAVVLHPQGLSIKAPAQLAEMLVPIMGGSARYIMGLALLGAGFSSLLANTQRGMVLLGAGLDKDVSLESKFIRIGCLVCLAFAMVVCYSYGGSPTQLILMANIATSIATPFGGLFMLLMIWRDDLSVGYKKPTGLRICMTISYIFAVIMTISGLSTQIPKILALFH